jgi:uncharacterized membrane protein
MKKAIVRARQINRALADQYFYPLVVSSVLAIGLFAGRVYLYHTYTFGFLVWNLILAWLPYVWSVWAASIHRRYPRRWWSLLVPGALWLLFFPNAPYILTDFLHLYQRPPVPLWYDIGLLASFAWAGCFLAVASLSMMHTIIKDYVGQRVSWLFVLAILGLSGLGIYVGRFLRWNSWDLVLYPNDVLYDIGHRLIHPFRNLQAYGVTLMFAAFLFVCYWTFVSIRRQTESSK